MRVDNGSAGFDARYALVDDLLGQNWNSGLDPTRRGSVPTATSIQVFLAMISSLGPVLGCPSLNHGSARRGKDIN
jgi:hypothetical protein